MEDIRALYIIANAGFADEVMEIVRNAGASGATILNARGTGAMHKKFLGISMDTEKEIILSIVEKDIAEAIMTAIKADEEITNTARPVCFTMTVDKTTMLKKSETSDKN